MDEPDCRLVEHQEVVAAIRVEVRVKMWPNSGLLAKLRGFFFLIFSDILRPRVVAFGR